MNKYMFVNNIPGTWALTWMKQGATNQLSHTAKHCAERGSHSRHPSGPHAADAGARQDRAGLAGQGSGMGDEGGNVEEMEPDCGSGETVGMSETCGDVVEEVAGGSD